MRIPAFTIGVMSEVLERANIDPGPAFRAAGLDPVIRLPPSGFVSAQEEISFERVFLSLTPRRPDLWLEVGRRHRLLAYGNFGLALGTSPSLRQWVKLSGRARDLCFSFADYQPVDRGGKLCGIEFCFEAVPEDRREMTFYRDLGALSTVLEEVWHGPTTDFCIELGMPVANRELIRGIFSCRVVFNASSTRVTWPTSLTDMPLPFGSEYLHQYYADQCKIPGSPMTEDGLEAKVISLITLQPSMLRTVEAIAARLNMSVRTLQRRLSSEGLTFRSLLMRAHIEVAQTYLRSSSLSISQIASILGYADRTSFDLAFSRWTDVSPRKFRDSTKELVSNHLN